MRVFSLTALIILLNGLFFEALGENYWRPYQPYLKLGLAFVETSPPDGASLGSDVGSAFRGVLPISPDLKVGLSLSPQFAVELGSVLLASDSDNHPTGSCGLFASEPCGADHYRLVLYDAMLKQRAQLFQHHRNMSVFLGLGVAYVRMNVFNQETIDSSPLIDRRVGAIMPEIAVGLVNKKWRHFMMSIGLHYLPPHSEIHQIFYLPLSIGWRF